MATLLRSVARQGRFIATAAVRRQIPACFISTSNKKKDVVSHTDVTPMESPKSEELKQLEKHFANDDPDDLQNWVPFGFHDIDRDLDRFLKNMTMFFFITVGICGAGFILAYQPDHKLQDWSVREAYLELERRERNGLPLIDRNMLDPATVELPSDEELGNTEVII
ncbi:hypothetical protein CHS0354_010152 [Potamilus streckersoni]|uniref:NADH dehydrogenase [ubiquinone] 1 beta subcomplex subunit 11, mitochondrial n=1 Tax=Potamilus streckersoni TaxID=2493646 RepID=A0AAE0S326_9BIVA|nr:hypothetical protein CHS0354_010152 [Potamilus streckersoni]